MNIFYPDNLPITDHKNSIIKAIIRHQVVVIAGDTGSGKTTQLPKMILEALPENNLLIGCTQPRRIAASTVAARVAEELGEAGDSVGYKIRFHDYTTPATKIKFMTDGVLLAETRQDRDLSAYGAIIVDEAHERSLNIDFLLGYLKQLLWRRKDLRLIITSATIDTAAFSSHFNDAPVITVSGRTYPVTLRYNPPGEDLAGEKDGQLDHCVQTVVELFDSQPEGDILVFLATERDILDCCGMLEKKIPQAIILPLFGRLPAGDQRRIFQNFGKVKVVVATNVAETSVTVPGIRYVVDSGLARISHYNVRAKTTSLPVSRISRASCDQRKGRCGRVAPGLCIRLYSEEDFLDRPEYTLPELKRSNLAEVILQMISLGLGHPEKFPFIDPPFKNAVKEGFRLLRELGAVDDSMRLTKRGRVMADLPIDPCIARIILEARENNCLREIKIISAALAIQDPRIRPVDLEKEADSAHRKFGHPHSDFMVLLNIWRGFHDLDKGSRKSWSKLKKYCKSHFLSFQRMREWFDLHDQLDRLITRREGLTDNLTEASYEQIHKSLLVGFLRNLARKRQGHIYQGTHNKELMIFPGSHQFSTGGEWLVAASFMETSKLFALTVATIEPDWIETVAAQLCKYSWSNAHWQKKSGRVIAEEQVSLFGLIIATGRKINFGKRHKKNISEARDIFIQSALVSGELNGSYKFLAHNLDLLQKWQDAEEKMRVRNIVSDDTALAAFYSERIPANVYDQSTLNRFLKKKRSQSFLYMQDEDVLVRRPEDKELVDYPLFFSIGNMQLRLEYHFEPGSDHDGVTYRLPADFAATVSPELFEWLVPGLLKEKLSVLLRSLPKAIRKKLVPLSDTVDRLLDDLDFGSGSFYSALEASILKQFKLLIRRSDWTDNLPPHLQPRFVLFDAAGKDLSAGRDLQELLHGVSQIKESAGHYVLGDEDEKIFQHWQGSEHTTWDFSSLPKTVTTYTPQGDVAGFLFPAVVADRQNGCIRIAFEKDKLAAEKLNKEGTLYLYSLHFGNHYKALKKLCNTSLSGPSSLWLLHMGLGRKEIVDKMLDCILLTLFAPIPGEIIAKEHFFKKIKEIEERGFYASAQNICHEIMTLIRKRRTAQESLTKIFNSQGRKLFIPADSKADLEAHLNDIFPADFLAVETPPDFSAIARQLQCFMIRLERFQGNPGKDSQKSAQLLPYQNRLRELEAKKGRLSEEALDQLSRFADLIDEYRISLFSPEIKTREPVSPQKLDQQWRLTLARC